MNQAIFIGNLTADAQQRTARDMVTTYATFTVAVNRRLKDGASSVTYVDCLFGGNTAGLMPYLTKGKRVAVTGRVSCRAWIDRQGQPHANLELFVRDIELCGGRDADTAAASPATVQQAQPVPTPAPATAPQTQTYAQPQTQTYAQPQPQAYAPAPAAASGDLPF